MYQRFAVHKDLVKKTNVRPIESHHALSQSETGISISEYNPDVRHADEITDHICIYMNLLIELNPANLKPQFRV